MKHIKKHRVVSSFDVGREIYTDEYVTQLEEKLAQDMEDAKFRSDIEPDVDFCLR